MVTKNGSSVSGMDLIHYMLVSYERLALLFDVNNTSLRKSDDE